MGCTGSHRPNVISISLRDISKATRSHSRFHNGFSRRRHIARSLVTVLVLGEDVKFAVSSKQFYLHTCTPAAAIWPAGLSPDATDPLSAFPAGITAVGLVHRDRPSVAWAAADATVRPERASDLVSPLPAASRSYRRWRGRREGCCRSPASSDRARRQPLAPMSGPRSINLRAQLPGVGPPLSPSKNRRDLDDPEVPCGVNIQLFPMEPDPMRTRPRELRQQADRYRAMALGFSDAQTICALGELANEYEALAAKMEADECHAERGSDGTR
jgi:hypothetical protein